jgi:hypothetical protein
MNISYEDSSHCLFCWGYGSPPTARPSSASRSRPPKISLRKHESQIAS